MYIPKRVFDGQQCISFAAHMSGSDVGSLEVLRMTSAGDMEVLYSQKGELGSGEWFSRQLETTISASDRGVSERSSRRRANVDVVHRKSFKNQSVSLLSQTRMHVGHIQHQNQL